MRGIVGQERQDKRDEKEKSRGIRKWSREERMNRWLGNERDSGTRKTSQEG